MARQFLIASLITAGFGQTNVDQDRLAAVSVGGPNDNFVSPIHQPFARVHTFNMGGIEAIPVIRVTVVTDPRLAVRGITAIQATQAIDPAHLEVTTIQVHRLLQCQFTRIRRRPAVTPVRMMEGVRVDGTVPLQCKDLFRQDQQPAGRELAFPHFRAGRSASRWQSAVSN